MHTTIKKVSLALAIACVLNASNTARAVEPIFQDDMEGGDYGARYVEDSEGLQSYTEWGLGSGNNALTWELPNKPCAIHTSSIKNGEFLNTEYTVSLRLWNEAPIVGQSLSITLLNNGYVSSTNSYAGYKVLVYPAGGSVVLTISKIKPDGTEVDLESNWNMPYPAKRDGYWENITASVKVGTTATEILLKWDGLDQRGDPISHIATATDSDPDRYVSGRGLGIIGYSGDAGTAVVAPGDPKPGIYLDDLVVVPVATEP